MATNNRVSAHASRNAGKLTQDSAPKKSKRPVGSDALANTKALMTSGQKANKTAVLQLIDDFYEYRDQRIDDIWDSQSQDNRMTKEWIRKQMTSSAYASAARAPNYWNGYVSKVQQELKEEDPRKLRYHSEKYIYLIIGWRCEPRQCACGDYTSNGGGRL